MAAILEIHKLTKEYGDRTAVDALDLTVQEGELYGFVGPNGAGKTSTLRMIATLLRPTKGEIFVAGHSVSQAPERVRRVIGYMPDYFGVYEDMKVWEYLDFFAACYQVPEPARPALIEDLLELFDLEHRRDDRVDRLSRGLQQRLSLARTLIHDPQVLVLDEPGSGLDPRARVEIRELLVELARMGKTIFFSTHILADVAEICTHVGILEAGRLVASGTLEELQIQLIPRRRVEISLLNRPEEALEILRRLPGVMEARAVENPENTRGQTTANRLEIEFSGGDEGLSHVLAELVGQGFPVLQFFEDRRDLEEVFLRATKGLVT